MNLKSRVLTWHVAAAGALICASSVLAQTVVGQWDFNNGNLSGTTGGDLNYAEGVGGATDEGTDFGNTTALAVPDIGGTAAQVMRFSANTNGGGFMMPVPATSNGGGSLLNEWTLLVDVLYPAASAGKERPLLDIDGSLFSTGPDIVVGANNALGVGGGATFAALAPNTWYRLGVVATADTLRFYTNGVFVGSTGSGGLDGRFALASGSTALLFGTPAATGGAQGVVNSIQLREGTLTAGQMFALAGPSAAGVPQTIPPIPSFVERWIPSGALANRSTPLGVVLNKGDTTIENTSISLKLDGTALTDVQFVPSGSTLLVVKSNNPSLALSSHTLELSYTDSEAGAKTFSHQFKAVLLYEDFEGLPLGASIEESPGTEGVWTPTPPPGWITNHSGMPGYGDPATDGMVEWAGWTFATKDFWISADDQTRSTFNLASGTLAIADPDEWDDGEQPTTDEETGGALYFNSFLTTAPVNITGTPANSMYVSFASSWRPEAFDDWAPQTNNQTATVTVSYDGGAPVEVLRYDSDPASPTYKADAQNEQVFIRLNNPANATNMVLTFGLTRAANDWWWAFDNLEVGAGAVAPVLAVEPESQLVSPGADIILRAEATGSEPFTYQWYFNNNPVTTGGNAGQLLLAAVTTNTAGNYQVVISNEAGSVTSRVASITVFSGEVTDDLVAHLKFDGNYSDASGRNNAGTAVNSPSFEAGKIGQAVHLNSAAGLDPNNYVTLGYPNDLKFGAGENAVDISFSMWTKVLAHSGDKPFLSNKDWDAGGNRGLVLSSLDGGFKWNLRDDISARRDSQTVGAVLNDGNWHHLAVTMDREGAARTYIDGQLVDTTSIAPDAGNAIGSLDTDDLQLAWNLGQDGSGEYGSSLEVVMDDVGIWRRSLTGQEVVAIYNAGLNAEDLSLAEVSSERVVPGIAQQPLSQTVEEGVTVTFTVSATGTPPLQYQWYRNNSAIEGANASTLTLSQVEAAQAGTYTVVVTNLAGSVTSAAANLVVSLAQVTVTGQWDFNAGDLSATVGAPLTNFNDTVAADTSFGTTTQLGIPDVAGAPANVLHYTPSGGAWPGYIMPHGAAPNGGGTFVNRYTIVYDVLYPASSDSTWRALLQTSSGNANDGDLFINNGNGIGISGNYQGTVTPDVWHRIVVTVDLTSSTLKKYIDGQLVGTQVLGEGVDGRWSLDPVALLFADEDGETNPGYVNAIQFRRGVMSDAEVASLGGVSAVIPGMAPRISSISRTDAGIVITWQAAPTRKLQQNTTLGTAGWTDVPASLGAGTVTVQPSEDAAFFRLAE